MFTFLSNNHFVAQLTNSEALDVILASQPLPDLIRIAFTKTQSPIYYLFLRLNFVIFGTSEIAVKGFQFFILLMVSLATFFLGKRLWGKKTGTFAALLVLTNPFIFSLSTTSNSTLLFFLFTLMSTYFFITKKWKLYTISSLLAFYTHPLFVLFFATQHLWISYELAIKKRERIKKRLKYGKHLFCFFHYQHFF